MKKLILLIVVIAAIGVGAGAYYMNRTVKEPEVKTGQITRGDIVEVVPATGTLEAVTTDPSVYTPEIKAPEIKR